MYPIYTTAEGLTATGGVDYGYALPIGFHWRAFITRLYVAQTSGSLDGFTYALYTSSKACPPGPSPSTAATVTRGLYRVVPAISVASGKTDAEVAWPTGADPVNRLWQPYAVSQGSPSPQAATGFLYLDLSPAGSGAKTFDVSLTLVEPMK